MNYLVADFIIRIKNAAAAGRKHIVLPYSNLTKEIAHVLTKQRVLENVAVDGEGGKKTISADIVYENRRATFTDAHIISKPSLRVYAKAREKAKLQGMGLATVIVSTNSGVMTGKEAVKKGVGGELLFELW